MKKLNIILDFNNLATRAMFTCQYMDGANIVSFDTEDECGYLLRKMAIDVSYILRLFGPDRVIFAADAKHPWRNSLYADLGDEKYKGTRKKDESKNWTNIYKTYDEFKEYLREYGCVVSEINNAEADDVSAMWIEKLHKRGRENVLLVSSDKDWLQQLDFCQTDNSFVACFNPIVNNKGKKKLYGTQEFMDWLSSPDVSDIFFSSYDETKKKFNDIKSIDSKLEYDVVNPSAVLLEKVMCGDSGDNVPSFYEYYKNGKKVRLTELKAKHICESLSISNVADLGERINNETFLPALESEMKVTVQDMLPHERYDRQRRLVELNVALFPTKILEDFGVHFENSTSTGHVNTRTVKMEDILANSKYLSQNFQKPKENSIFADVRGLEKFIKPLF